MKKLLASFAPSQDQKDRFFSTTPTSLGWALAPLIAEIDKGNIPQLEYCPKIYDPLRVYPGIWEDFKILLNQEKPDALLLASTYDSHYSAVRMAVLAKAYNPEMLIIYGGPHVDEVADVNVINLMPQIYPFNEEKRPFDILVTGDGEMILLQLIKEYAKYDSLSDFLSYLDMHSARLLLANMPGNFKVHVKNKNGEVRVITSHGVPLGLSKLPFMPRKLFGNNMDLYGFSCFHEETNCGTSILLPSVSTMLHRGCRNFCLFCSERGGYHARHLEHIEAELDQLVGMGIKGVFFDDSTFGDHENIEDLLTVLQKFPLQYGSLNRFDELTEPHFVEKLARAGFVYQYCSIEQFDSAVLKQNGKGQSLDSIRHGVANLEANGLKLGTSLLFGLQGETKDSINTTLDFVSAIDKFGLLSCVSMSIYSFHPGTPLTLGSKIGKAMHKLLRFDQEPPNQGEPWDSFEEGQWFHPAWVTAEGIEYIYQQAQTRVGTKLVRNMRKDGGI
ncbi:MAG: B12-binding domain-containing radical SAM protein [Patescibacteria group bacterium]|jgi:radical SAM superfamily enzyme YgiQ (UPF0313 family)